MNMHIQPRSGQGHALLNFYVLCVIQSHTCIAKQLVTKNLLFSMLLSYVFNVLAATITMYTKCLILNILLSFGVVVNLPKRIQLYFGIKRDLY